MLPSTEQALKCVTPFKVRHTILAGKQPFFKILQVFQKKYCPF
jgi:hypothetical protein